MLDRRQFIGVMGAITAPAFALPAFRSTPLPRRDAPPDDVARDEDYWAAVQAAFTVDRSVLNLNNGGVSPAPLPVQEAVRRHLDFCNTMPPPVALWRMLEPQRETVRSALAAHWGCDPEELAITRNASESLQICQLGTDLKAGDEVLTTTQDYPRMLTTFKQRERREGIKLVQVKLPIPAEDNAAIVRLFEAAITPRTRLMLISHMVNITGQIMPVRDLCDMARTRNIPVIVDGAHAFAHLDFKIPDLGCDYYGVSLHKWLFAPHGTGLLYVRRDRVKALWPMMAADEKLDDDIRKFEEIGTHPAAQHLAIAEALAFHQAIGGPRKLARMRLLREKWSAPLRATGKARLHTSMKPEFSAGIATVQLDGIDSGALADQLWTKHHILVTPIKHAEFEGVRVTPSVYTTMPELARFVRVMLGIIEKGLPATP